MASAATMERFDKAFTAASRRVATAAARTIRDYNTRALPDEPSITAALVTRLQDTLNQLQTPGIVWAARILSSHGPKTEEARYGADFLGVLNLQLPGYNVKKRFLAQAKRQEPGEQLSSAEWRRLVGQCEKMLGITSESFVFTYARNGVIVVPAVSVMACAGAADLHTLHPKQLGRFYKEHFECWIGDLESTALPGRYSRRMAPFLLDGFGYSTGLELEGKRVGEG